MTTSSTEVIGELELDDTRRSWTPTSGERVVVYGAGGFARDVVRVVRDRGAIVCHALDRRGGAASVHGVRVYRPDDDPLSVVDRPMTTAVVAVFNRDVDPNEIEWLLRSGGYGRVVGVPELYETFADTLGSRYWLAQRSVYGRNKAKISMVGDLWADAESRALYRSVLTYRTGWSAAAAPRPCEGPQYFAGDVPRTLGPVAWVDCGAFDGDTLLDMASTGVEVAEAFAFEPDLTNFAQLVLRAREFASDTGARVSLWPCAVAGASGMRRFHDAAGEASALTADGTTNVSAIAIDDALPNASVTDLKMDIEGAEMDALAGARRLIRRCRPRLAICVYHRPQDLWEIPLFVHGLGLEYDLYLRSHGHYGFDLVMYAVPRRS